MLLHDGCSQCPFLSLELGPGPLLVKKMDCKPREAMLDEDLVAVDLHVVRLFLRCFGEVIVCVSLKHSRAQPSGR